MTNSQPFQHLKKCLAALLAGALLAAHSYAAESPTSSGEAATVDTPIVRVPMAGKAPTIDGNFAEGEWDDAAGLSGFWYDFGQADFRFLAPPQTQLQVYVCYDKENLYIAYVSPVYPEKSWLKARGRFPDTQLHPLYGVLWDDHIELEIRPFADNVKAFQLGLLKWVINPIGTVSDQHWSPKEQPGFAWQSGSTVRCGVTDKTWVLEMAIPFKNLKPGDYAGNDADGTPLVKIPPPDGTAYRAWFTRSIGGNGDFFNAFDKHVWNTTKTKLVFDSQAPSFQINDLGPIMDDNIDVKLTIKSHSKQAEGSLGRREAVRVGFFVESAGGLIYSSYDAPELKDGIIELLPGETKKLRLRHPIPGISKEGNVLWFDVRSAGNPAKVLFRTRLIDFHSMEGGAENKQTFKQRRIDVIEKLRPERKDFDFRHQFSSYAKRLAVVVDVGINGASEKAKTAKEMKVTVTTADQDERVILEQKVPFTSDFACAILDLPKLVSGEKYKFSVLLFDENKRIVGDVAPDPFSYQEEPWMNNKIGLDDVVWEPFIPIAPTPNGFETLKHKFTVDPSGLPAQIVIKHDPRDLPLEKRAPGAKLTDAELLALGRGPQLRAPVRLEAVVAGQRVPAQVIQPAKAIRTWKSEIEYESKLKIGPVDAAMRVRYDCDGSMHVKMTYGSAAPAEIDRLELVADLAGAVDLALGTMHGGGMQGADSWECELPKTEGIVWDSGAKERAELYYSKFVPFFFVGSGDRAFSWYCDSDRQWILDKNGSTMTVERDKTGAVTWRTLFVNHKADVAGSRTIDFTLLTHPAKSKPADFRKIAWQGRGMNWASNYRMEPLQLTEEYLKPRVREATGAPKDLPDDQLSTYRNEKGPWYRYGRLRNEGVWPDMDRNFEDKTVFYMEQHIRIGRRVGEWWDEYWPVYRTDNLAEGDAYIRDAKSIEKNELPWQSGHLTGHMRDTHRRLSRVRAANNVPLRNFYWANNSATLLESFGWDTQLVEECGAGHRSYELDNIAVYPASLMRYFAHNYTGLVCRMVADVGGVPAGDDPKVERQLYGRALINDIGFTPDGPHGRMLNPDIMLKLMNALNEFGYFDDQNTEAIPYWRISQWARYGQPVVANDAFATGEGAPASKVLVAAYRRPFEMSGRKGFKTMFVLINESSVPVREPFYITQPERFFGGPMAQRYLDLAGTFAIPGIGGDSDWKITPQTKPETLMLLDLESRGVIEQAPSKEKGLQSFGPVYIAPHDYRIIYGYGFTK